MGWRCHYHLVVISAQGLCINCITVIGIQSTAYAVNQCQFAWHSVITLLLTLPGLLVYNFSYGRHHTVKWPRTWPSSICALLVSRLQPSLYRHLTVHLDNYSQLDTGYMTVIYRQNASVISHTTLRTRQFSQVGNQLTVERLYNNWNCHSTVFTRCSRLKRGEATLYFKNPPTFYMLRSLTN